MNTGLALAPALLLVICGFGPDLALAQGKASDPFAVPSIMVEEPGAPKQTNRDDGERRHTKGRHDTKKQEEHAVHIPRGSGNFVPPTQLPRTPLLTQPETVAPYSPPPVSNPSAQITQFNHSFLLNGGLGNNPSNRDAYIRYNFNNR
jgi:hypothetical protein